MNKNFRRHTVAASITTAICIYALWWSGSTSGADNTCNMLGIQAAPYCQHNAQAHAWWLLIAAVALGYLVFYVVRARKILRQDQHERDI